ncbi:MAG: DNA photolyase [Desulfofustis sp. PB-SRB1]|nr:DNA photolyase [Desulfofustis sp. PB-SRB1]MBM1003572.1 DNA photolyase [Desulfofustis sp. PB-SRB1]HBH29902.1 DNA photolyase [Desulfofustis sp.]HBH31437.1 DNA photolyase [Desulfofustis sp.]
MSSVNPSDPSHAISRILVVRSCQHHPEIERILTRSRLPHEVIDDGAVDEVLNRLTAGSLSAGKKILLLRTNKGGFIKQCPATRCYRCCRYRILYIGGGCPMDCSYCILQAYLNQPCITSFVNVEDLTTELKGELNADMQLFLRYGSGEFTDSLALDPITNLSSVLVPLFASQDRALLELKTKSASIDGLKDISHHKNTIVSWSLNSEKIIACEEHGSASLGQRLAAAAQCSSWGYPLAFHFDPIIAHHGWREGYENTIEQLFAAVPANSIKWISMGAFRFMPKLKKIGGERFPYSEIFSHEFITGLDQKKRYFRSLRVELYKHVYDLLKAYADPRTCIYFCMESDEIWHEVMGFVPSDRNGLQAMLDAAAMDRSIG